MYVNQTLLALFVTFSSRMLVTLGIMGLLFNFNFAGTASAQPQVIRNITQPTQRLELTVNTSRILTLDKRVPKMVVNNPELVSVTPISANQVQIAAKKPGVTQINLWDEDDQIYTVDLTIYGDVRELEHALKRLFPESSVKVLRLTSSLVLEGFVERPEAVGPIVRLAEDYAPKIVNNITVGGVQQILLKVKVMEVSRTKLRNLGADWKIPDATGFAASTVSGLIASVGAADAVPGTSGGTFQAFVGNGSFFTILDALQQNNVAKVLADPTITAISGRPAHFNVGGELPIIIPSGIGQTTIEYKKFGTQVDFVPIVLGNGNIRLEVRPRVSEIDDTRSVNVGQFTVPALKVREVDTAVELKAGQTLALAGLVQTRIEAQERALPFFGNLPFVGAAFRSVREEVNEIELLIMVTPEFAEGMEPHEVPQCGPGMESVSPNNCELYFGGHLEVPSCGPCGPYQNTGCQSCYNGAPAVGTAYASDEGFVQDVPGEIMQLGPSQMGPVQMGPVQMGPVQMGQQPAPINYPGVDSGSEPITQTLPSLELSPRTPPVLQPSEPALDPGPAGAGTLDDSSAHRQTSPWMPNLKLNPMQTPFARDSQKIPATAQQPRRSTSTPGLMGPIGYDVEK